MTIVPGELLSVLGAADPESLLEQDLGILTRQLWKREATYQNGAPNTVKGPPASGDHLQDEFWRDSLGAEFWCVTAGNPGVWKQTRPAFVSASPAGVPAGYWIARYDQNFKLYYYNGTVWVESFLYSTPVAMAALAVDWSIGTLFTKSLAANSVFTFSNTQEGQAITIVVTNPATWTLTWPAITWVGGTTPVQSTGNKTDVYRVVKVGGVFYGRHFPQDKPTAHTHDAADVVSGTLNDLRLSANVPLKNTANTFSEDQTGSKKITAREFATSAPALWVHDSKNVSVSGNNLALPDDANVVFTSGTINTVSNVRPGATYIIVATGALTLTDGAKVVCRGGDVVLAVDESVIVVGIESDKISVCEKP